MGRPSGSDKFVRFSADEIPPATSEDLERLRVAADEPVDTSEIPEWTGGGSPVARDGRGRLVRRPIGQIGRAILEQLDRKQMTRYRLCRDAKFYCPTLTESAVYGFLEGSRQIEVPYVEALLRAVGLTIRPAKVKNKAKVMAKSVGPGTVMEKRVAAKAAKAAKATKAASVAPKKAASAKKAASPKKGASAGANQGASAKKASKKTLA
jgi:hypothetical protein